MACPPTGLYESSSAAIRKPWSTKHGSPRCFSWPARPFPKRDFWQMLLLKIRLLHSVQGMVLQVYIISAQIVFAYSRTYKRWSDVGVTFKALDQWLEQYLLEKGHSSGGLWRLPERTVARSKNVMFIKLLLQNFINFIHRTKIICIAANA